MTNRINSNTIDNKRKISSDPLVELRNLVAAANNTERRTQKAAFQALQELQQFIR